ncbi:translation initiation factor IF-2 subunit gamma [Candidatus Pacearchaeota archaeon]|nr:translation initiation factor IF-2 subunit gamma [Candidatus Pacearchaeota archaeon]
MAEFKQPVLSIGLVGHIDHGKTTLLWQLSGKWTDTHSEELKRGITIKLGYADVMINKCDKCQSPSCFTREKKCKNGEEAKPYRYVSFVDVPGHEMLMAAMLSGAAIIDAALLVIAANEPCPRPQTREHLVALEAKGIKNIIIIQNKVDLVTKEEALKNYEEIKQFIKGTIGENAPIIPCSAQQGINIDMILAEICEIGIPHRDTHSKPIFFVARSFDINRPGTDIKELSGGVLGGVLKQGTLKEGDEIEIKPGLSVKKHNLTEYKTIKTKILSIYSGNTQIKEALPSGSLALQINLDPLLTKADSLAGCIVSKIGNLPEIQNRIKLKVQLFKEAIGTETKESVVEIKTSEILMLSINTSITVGTVVKIGKEIELVLKIPIVAIPGTKVGIARNIKGHFRLIGVGEII